ncbi:TRL domain-containing protein [Leptospira ryugenii]|uniref:TRL domain-containing protein n=1 Tax=Leptospira ryugenii TaxID=1917863 RepID=UPI0014355C2A|nr:TRL domain-containing protein [Leptospira ryugenii]
MSKISIFLLVLCITQFNSCIVTEERVTGFGLSVAVTESSQISPKASLNEFQREIEACAFNFFYLISFGDRSFRKILQKASQFQIHVADQRIVHYHLSFIFINIICTRVVGKNVSG